MKRRNLLKGIIGLTGAGLICGIYSWQIEPFWVEFIKKKMPVKNLPAGLNGLMLMQISDIHVGNNFDWNYLIESFKKAQKFNPDFVVYTGDFMSYEGPEQLNQLKKVLEHKVKGKYGTIGILGNHDYGKNWSENNVASSVTKLLNDAGVQVLRNNQIEIKGLNFIGFDDLWGTNFLPEKIIRYYDKTKANIVLCHNPDACDLNIWNGYTGWILSGHTHGGQVKPPFLNPTILPVKNKKYSAGEIDLKDGRTLYINRALGHLMQVRFNVRPEITLFELRSS